MAFDQGIAPTALPFHARRSDLVLSDGDRWYVVNTLANREAGAEAQLLAQGFRTFLPRVPRTIRHARKIRTVHAPFFSSYLFVILNLGRDRWRSVNGTFGVASLIMAGETPQPAPGGIVEQLLDYADEAGVLRFDDDLREGQAIRVTVGPFARVLGRLERLDPRGRVCVLLDIMGGKVSAQLDRHAIEAA